MPRTLSLLIERAASACPSAVAILGHDRLPLTYAGLLQQVRDVVDMLNSFGVGRKDRVAIVLPNGPDMAVAFLSVAAGSTAAPLNPAYRAEEFDFYLDDLEAKALILQAGSDSVARDVARRRGIPVIELHPLADAGTFALSGTAGSPPREAGFSDADDVALVLHTSGTTARPKIVPLSQANICASAHEIRNALALTSSDRCLNVMPLFHIHGLIGALLSSMSAGGSVRCMSGFSAPEFLDSLTAPETTWYTAVPTMHRALVDHVERTGTRRSAPGLRFIRSCSSPLPPSLMTSLEALFGVPVLEAYGMTEASHQIAVNPMPPLARKPGSVGLPTGTEVCVLDPEGEYVPPGATGEIAIKGAGVTAGYANNPKANAAAFANGWFRTGDQGHIDEDGYIFLTGRIKELINRGGEKIAPREIDEILLLHPAVEQCVAFAAPHPTLGEEVAAAVVLKPGSEATTRALQEFAAGRLAEFKVPRRIVFVAQLPKGPTGKLQRVGLADKLGVTFCQDDALANGPFVAPADEREAKLAEAMAAALQRERVSATESFFDLGGDSLAAAAMVSAVRERFGWKLTLPHLYRFPSVKELARLVPTLDVQESAQLEDPAGSLLRFNEAGELPPLYFMHSSHEAAACCAELASQCGPNQPIFVLPASGARGEAIPPTIEEMAAHAATLVRSTRSRGPYYIAGFCRSGPVALELAHQLQRAGDQVKTLVLIDSGIENTHPFMPWLQRLIQVCGAVSGWSTEERLRRFLSARELVAGIDRWRNGLETRRSVQPSTESGTDDDRIRDSYLRARSGYVPRRYTGRVVVLKAATELFDSRWRKVAPGLDLAETPGGHITCLTHYMHDLCGHLRRALNDRSDTHRESRPVPPSVAVVGLEPR